MFAYNDWSGTGYNELTRWGPETHICVSKLTTINSDNGLSPGRRQTIIWANAGILLIGPMGTNFSEIVIKIYAFSLKKMHCKMLSGKWWPYCLSLNVLSHLFCTQSLFLYIHIDVRTNWPILQLFSITFSRSYSQGFYWQWVSICSGEGFMSNRRQAITWTNVDPVHWYIFASLGLNMSTQVKF